MQRKTTDIFFKHYNFIKEDFEQFKDFSPAMLKIVSFNLKKLEKEILENTTEISDDSINTKWNRTQTK